MQIAQLVMNIEFMESNIRWLVSIVIECIGDFGFNKHILGLLK